MGKATSRTDPSVAVLLAVISAYAAWFRVEGIAGDFWLMHDQIRDWNRVQGSLLDLPLHGTERSGGGYHWGPAFYWFLWSARMVPGTANLPHVGGIAVSLFGAVSFGILGWAMYRSGAPLIAVVGPTLLLATLPYEAALARAAWNPNFALGCVNLSLAALLLGQDGHSRTGLVLVGVFGWMAVHAHTGALPIVLAIFLVAVWGNSSRGWRSSVSGALILLAVVAVLQLPWILVRPTPDDAAPTAIAATLNAMIGSGPKIQLGRGLDFVLDQGPRLLAPGAPRWVRAVIVVGFPLAAALALTLCVRVASMRRAVWASLVAFALAVAAYTVVQEELQRYWLIPLVGPVVVLSIAALSALQVRRELLVLIGTGVAILSVAVQPSRVTLRRWDHSYPAYAAVVAGAGQVVTSQRRVRDLVGPADHRFPTSSSSLVGWLGGALDPGARVRAIVQEDGSVLFQADSEAP